jgi:acyl carrier protein
MTTLEAVQAILKTNFDLSADVLRPDARLEDLAIDSLSMIEVMFALEDEFNVSMPPEPATLNSQLQTVGDLVSYVDQLIAEQRPAEVAAELS